MEGPLLKSQENQRNHNNTLVTLYLFDVWMIAITNKNLMIYLLVKILCIDGLQLRSISSLQISKIHLLAAVKLPETVSFVVFNPPIPVARYSKTCVCGRLLLGIAVSNLNEL